MHATGLKRLMERWGLSQEKFANVTGVNRGTIQTYTRKKNPAKPNIEFMITVEKLTGDRITARQIWENDFNDIDIPDHPVYENVSAGKKSSSSTRKVEDAFRLLMKEFIGMQEKIKSLEEE